MKQCAKCGGKMERISCFDMIWKDSQTMSGEPRRAVESREPVKERGNRSDSSVSRARLTHEVGGANPSRLSAETADTALPFYPSCMNCRRFLVVGELYRDGFRDGQIFCHACLRDAHMAGYYAADETISGHEDTEERYS